MKYVIAIMVLLLVGLGVWKSGVLAPAPLWELRQTGEVRNLKTHEFIKAEPSRTWNGSKFAEDGHATFPTRAECDQRMSRMLEAASAMPRLVGGRLPNGNGIALFDIDEGEVTELTWSCATVGSK